MVIQFSASTDRRWMEGGMAGQKQKIAPGSEEERREERREEGGARQPGRRELARRERQERILGGP